MKKKTYKQMQNRLYREIKRRMIAEKRIMIPLEVRTDGRQIDTLEIRNIIPYRMCVGDYEHIIKSAIANKLATKLIADQYVMFYTHKSQYEPTIDSLEIRARIDVAKPREMWGQEDEKDI